MQEFTFNITISADGETVVGEIHGIKGKKCTNVARLLDTIGTEIEHRHTAEYNEREPVRIGGQSNSGKLHLGR